MGLGILLLGKEEQRELVEDGKQQKLVPGPSSSMDNVLSCRKSKLIPGQGISWQKI